MCVPIGRLAFPGEAFCRRNGFVAGERVAETGGGAGPTSGLLGPLKRSGNGWRPYEANRRALRQSAHRKPPADRNACRTIETKKAAALEISPGRRLELLSPTAGFNSSGRLGESGYFFFLATGFLATAFFATGFFAAAFLAAGFFAAPFLAAAAFCLSASAACAAARRATGTRKGEQLT